MRTEHQERVSAAMKLHWKKRKAKQVRTGLFRYIPWAKIDDFHRRGWLIVADLGSEYSVLGWHCECGEVTP